MDLTYGERIVDREQGITQGALASYYSAVARVMLPHVVDRPLSVVRREGTVPHATINDARGLLALVEEFALEIHARPAHAVDLEHPDRLVFELDAGERVPFGEVGRAAKVLRALFHGLDLETFAMTRGHRGLAVVLPIRPELDWRDAHEFTKLVTDALVAAAPSRYTSRVEGDAPDKIHVRSVDTREATCVAPYSTQLLSNAPVALPAFWHELEELEPDALTPSEVVERLGALRGDPWERVIELDQRLTPERRRSTAVALERVIASD